MKKSVFARLLCTLLIAGVLVAAGSWLAFFLSNRIVEPLRQLELELSRQAQQQGGRTNLRLRDEGAAPERYKKAVEEYYRRLSGARPKQ